MSNLNVPFESLEPLTSYLEALDDVVLTPSTATMNQLSATDKVLTDRAVLFPKVFMGVSAIDTSTGESSEYKLETRFEGSTVSGGILASAKFASMDPESEEFAQLYRESFRPFPPHLAKFDNSGEKPKIVWEYSEFTPEQIKAGRQIVTLENRLNDARGAIITLGGHLAVSGAFEQSDIQSAYELLKDALGTFACRSEEGTTYAAFGLRRISKDLLGQYWYIVNRGASRNPIGRKEAVSNIDSAWQVVGKPYGLFSKLVGRAAPNPLF